MPEATTWTAENRDTHKRNESTILSFLTSSPGIKWNFPRPSWNYSAEDKLLLSKSCSCENGSPSGGCQCSGPRWLPRAWAQMVMSCVQPGVGTGPGPGWGPERCQAGICPSRAARKPLPGEEALPSPLCPWALCPWAMSPERGQLSSNNFAMAKHQWRDLLASQEQ